MFSVGVQRVQSYHCGSYLETIAHMHASLHAVNGNIILALLNVFDLDGKKSIRHFSIILL